MTIRQGARQLATGQRSRLHVLHVDSGEDVVIAESGSLLFEAPNWTPDGAWLLVNGDGGLFRVAPSGGGLVPVGLGDVPGINNDHVLSPDGSSAFVSAFVSAIGYPRPVDTVAARRSRAICWTAPRPLKAGFAIVGDLEAR